jgi:hypothetical protein
VLRRRTFKIKGEGFTCRKNILVLKYILGDKRNTFILAMNTFMESYLCDENNIFIA